MTRLDNNDTYPDGAADRIQGAWRRLDRSISVDYEAGLADVRARASEASTAAPRPPVVESSRWRRQLQVMLAAAAVLLAISVPVGVTRFLAHQPMPPSHGWRTGDGERWAEVAFGERTLFVDLDKVTNGRPKLEEGDPGDPVEASPDTDFWFNMDRGPRNVKVGVNKVQGFLSPQGKQRPPLAVCAYDVATGWTKVPFDLKNHSFFCVHTSKGHDWRAEVLSIDLDSDPMRTMVRFERVDS